MSVTGQNIERCDVPTRNSQDTTALQPHVFVTGIRRLVAITSNDLTFLPRTHKTQLHTSNGLTSSRTNSANVKAVLVSRRHELRTFRRIVVPSPSGSSSPRRLLGHVWIFSSNAVRTSDFAESAHFARCQRSINSRQNFVFSQLVKQFSDSVGPASGSPCSLKQFIWFYPKQICSGLKLHVLWNIRIRLHLRNWEASGNRPMLNWIFERYCRPLLRCWQIYCMVSWRVDVGAVL